MINKDIIYWNVFKGKGGDPMDNSASQKGVIYVDEIRLNFQEIADTPYPLEEHFNDFRICSSNSYQKVFLPTDLNMYILVCIE